MPRKLSTASLLLVLVTIGCAHYPVNARLDQYNKDAGYRFQNLSSSDNTDSLFIILAFSGGSFTAAYFALFGERIFTDFDSRFLKKDVEGDLKNRLYSPYNWYRLASTTFDRIDLAAEYYDEQLFEHRTFRDLINTGKRPYILINATDMTQGSQFEFTQDQFDLFCSDLSSYPIARAVAASSAFPVLLSPITINNYAGSCRYQEPPWVANAISDRDITTRRYDRALLLRSYLHADARPFIHLLDGGISDNIGLRGPLYSATSTDSPWSLLRLVNQNKVKKIVFIVVNAKTEPDTNLDRKESSPNLDKVLMTVATVPMDNYSFDTIALLKESLGQWEKDIQSRKDCEDVLKKNCPAAELTGGGLPRVKFYPVVVGFDSIEDENERSFFKNLPTSFKLSAESVDRLREVGARLLNASPEFQRLMKELNPSR